MDVKPTKQEHQAPAEQYIELCPPQERGLMHEETSDIQAQMATKNPLKTTTGVVQAWVGQKVTNITFSYGYFCTIFFTYDELKSMPQHTKTGTNIATMVV